MDWKEQYAGALFPFDIRVMKLPYAIKSKRSNREFLDRIIPDRRKPDLDLVHRLTEENIPTMLFKYRCFDDGGYSLKNFENDTLWLSRASSFNDPFDSISKNDSSTLGIMASPDYEKILSDFGYLDHAKESGILDIEFTDEMRKLFDVCYTLRTQTTFLIGCLSELNDSVLMWSHYANNHAGFCVGYGGSEIYQSDVIAKDIYPVLYKNFDELPCEDSALGLDFNSLYSVLRKSRQWEYEQEWRFIFDYRRMSEPGNIQLPIAKAVYLGVKTSGENQDKIIQIAKSKNVPVFKANMNINDGTLRFKEIPM